MARLRVGAGFVLLAFLFAAFSATAENFEKAPSFHLEDLTGKIVKLGDFSGKVVYLDFWGTWCPPCIEETPHLIELYKRYQDKGFVVVGISLGESQRSVENFVKKMKVPYPVLFGDEEVVDNYHGIAFLPTAFVIDRKGFIRRKIFGYRDKEEIEQLILPLLGES